MPALRFSGAAEPSTGARQMSVLVDQASVLPAMRAVKNSERPSGENTYSSSPPKGLLGTSPSIPGVSSFGSAAGEARSTMNSCERVPFFQVSQWRTNRRS